MSAGARSCLYDGAVARRLSEYVFVAVTMIQRDGIPLEVVSKVLLSHTDLKTMQMYLGKITGTEAIRWMDVLQADNQGSTLNPAWVKCLSKDKADSLPCSFIAMKEIQSVIE